MSKNDDLVRRLTGTEGDFLTAVDRLRLYNHDPKTFEFTNGHLRRARALLSETGGAGK